MKKMYVPSSSCFLNLLATSCWWMDNGISIHVFAYVYCLLLPVYASFSKGCHKNTSGQVLYNHDLCSDLDNLSNNCLDLIATLKVEAASVGFEPMTSGMLVQCSTN